MHVVEIRLDNVTGVVCPNVEICMNLTAVITFRTPAYAIEPFLINTAKTRTSPDCRSHIDSYLFFTPIYTNTLRGFLNHGLEPSLRLSSNPYLVMRYTVLLSIFLTTEMHISCLMLPLSRFRHKPFDMQ